MQPASELRVRVQSASVQWWVVVLAALSSACWLLLLLLLLLPGRQAECDFATFVHSQLPPSKIQDARRRRARSSHFGWSWREKKEGVCAAGVNWWQLDCPALSTARRRCGPTAWPRLDVMGQQLGLPGCAPDLGPCSFSLSREPPSL